jgi:2-furoate---CoA ligase
VNLAQSLLDACERHPELEAFPEVRYGELLRRVAHIAGGLGVEPGARVAAVLDNRLETALLYWGAQWAGAVFVPLSWRLSEDELAYCIDDAGAEVVIRDGDPLPDGPAHEGALDRDEREISLLLYTSGTTGRPKGVPRSHFADRAGGLGQALQHGYAHGDRTLGVMPLYHTMGIHSLIAMHLVGGCYVPQARWETAEALRLIQTERITSLYLVPTLFHDLVSHDRLDGHDLSSVRALGYAGAAMTSTVVKRCVEVFNPAVFVNHYGSTEVYTFSIGRDQAAKPGCAGRPSVNTRLKLEPDGEICVHLSGDEAFGGYWNRPDADVKALRGGWYHTGDTGHLDSDGDLWVDGRLDDMIISGGENIHPVEVEDVLASHPGVREVAVVGAPDARLGFRVVAVVVGDATAEELDAHCLASPLARFKRPREYRSVPALPKSASGKILRRALRSDSDEAIPAETGIALDSA